MHGFSTVDGFVEITESLAEMSKYAANEPSVGLFYVQQHAQNAIPNVIRLKNNVVEKSRVSNLHTEDLKDSITMVKSMKECGFPVAEEMIRDIRKSLVTMSAKQPRRGLINSPISGFQMGRTSSQRMGTWGRNGDDAEKDGKRTSSYISTVFKTAKEKASNFKWSPLDSTINQAEKLMSSNSSQFVTCTGSSLPDVEADELPLSSPTAGGQQLDEEEDQSGVNLPHHNILLLPENFDEFKADKEAELEEWLGGTADNLDKLQEGK
ncbi:MEF2B PROTEIN [Salix purpurea]|uniref:MEF2B PROTEIN n=1 Tax=Salix purpurea TaxID=77065 RepID=A0A9Q0TTL6_SALPP|nr:MEF2B PROTEIN [Salix purpurea]